VTMPSLSSPSDLSLSLSLSLFFSLCELKALCLSGRHSTTLATHQPF
jgi:hypothetical protein